MTEEYAGPLAATLNDDVYLAEVLLMAFKNPASQIGSPVVPSDEDYRNVLVDGHFDFVVIARIIRENLRLELIKWLERKAAT